MEEESLRVVREEAPDIRLGWSVPKLRRNYLANPFTKRAGAARRPVRAHGAARRGRRGPSATGRVDAIMSHWALVTPRLARVVEQAGGELYVWTVDDPTRIAKLDAHRRHRDHHQRPAAVRYRVISHDERDTRR